jgi:hypothetical protein
MARKASVGVGNRSTAEAWRGEKEGEEGGVGPRGRKRKPTQ